MTLSSAIPHSDFQSLDAQSVLSSRTREVSNYNDLNSLQSLKYGEADREARIEEVAKQFESLFVSMMIKSMREANASFGEDNPLNSNQVKMYQGMYDSQLAVSLSNSKGIGLAEVIKRQLSSQSPSLPSQPAQGYSLDAYTRQGFAINPNRGQINADKVTETIETVEQTIEKIDASAVLLGNDLSNAGSQPETPKSHDFSSPEAYIQSLLPYARQVEAETGIDARLMLAQSALETGWGQHQILHENGQPSFNLFGIKANHAWAGGQAEITTTEYHAGVPLKERAAFRSYDSYEQSFRDYAQFLQSNERYSGALAHREDPVRFAHALQESGYATDPQYGQKIESILDRYWQDTPISGSAIEQRLAQ